MIRSRLRKPFVLALKAGLWFFGLLATAFVLTPLIAPTAHPTFNIWADSFQFLMAADKTAVEVGYRTQRPSNWTYHASFGPPFFSTDEKPRYIWDSKRWEFDLLAVRIRREYKPYTNLTSGWKIAVSQVVVWPTLLIGLGLVAGLRLGRKREQRTIEESEVKGSGKSNENVG